MIEVKGREMVIPREEFNIGTTYDARSEMRHFHMRRVRQGGIDLAGLVFNLDLEYANGKTDTATLTKDVTDRDIDLMLTIEPTMLQVPGTVIIQIRALAEDGTVKWSSYKGAFFVEDCINTPAQYEGKITQLEQYEAEWGTVRDNVRALNSRMDEIVKMADGIDASDVEKEVTDARVGADGKKYESAGSAVREQITAEKDKRTAADASLNEAIAKQRYFATPQMYGETGKGNDLDVILSCLSENDVVFLPSGKYVIDGDLELNGKSIIGSNKEDTTLLFTSGHGIKINGRDVKLENLSITASDHYTGKCLEFTQSSDSTTVTKCAFINLHIYYFEYGIYAVAASLWDNVFERIIFGSCKNSIWLDASTTTSSDFCNYFKSIVTDNRVQGKLLHLYGCFCKFLNCNFATNYINAVESSTVSHLSFDTCSFESDIVGGVTGNGPLMLLDGQVHFLNCRWVHNFNTDGKNYIAQTKNVSFSKRIVFDSCHLRGYTGSKLTAFCDLNFGKGAEYGSVVERGNIGFNIFDTVQNAVKPYIINQNMMSTIVLYPNSYDKSKLIPNKMRYLYRKNAGISGTAYVYIPCIYNGTNLVDYDGNVLS